MTSSYRVRSVAMLVGLAAFGIAGSAAAEGDQPEPQQPSKQSKGCPKYSVPWDLRPAIASSILRADTVIASHDKGTTIVPTLAAGYALVPQTLGVYLRQAFVSNSPDEGKSGTALSNPLLFANYTPVIAPHMRLPVFVGAALPLGQGGGEDPDPAKAGAMNAAIPARSSVATALFANNYLVPTVGMGYAYVNQGLTVQAEATLLFPFKMRGPDAAKDNMINMTTGLHLGYYVTDVFSAGGELRYQRWLSGPDGIPSAAKDQMTAAIGPRANFRAGETIILRPGFAFVVPLDKPMSDAGYKQFMLDVPIIF